MTASVNKKLLGGFVLRAINSVQIIADYAQEQGINLASLLRDSDIDIELLQQLDAEIHPSQELAVLRNLLQVKAMPFRLGMELGLRYPLTSYGIFGYALLASPTVRQAIEFGIRYIELSYAFSKIELQQESGLAVLSFETPVVLEKEADLACLLLVRDMWAVTVMQGEILTAQDKSFEIEFVFAQPDFINTAQLKELESAIGAGIHFGARRNAFIGPAEILDQRLSKANAATARLCEQQCQQLLQQKQTWQGIEEQVRDAILHLGLSASMQHVADYLARTTRTLHRQLAQESNSWRQIRDQVRMGLAEELLLQPISLQDVTERLGYSDVSNFSHAFKRYSGLSPSRFRAAQKQN